MRRYLSSLGQPLVNLEPLYRNGAPDVQVYEHIATVVTAAALRYDRVSFIVPGHPLIYVTPTPRILEKARRLRIPTVVLPGISSFDTMVLQLNLDIADHGVQAFECNRYVYFGIKPNPRVPLFLFQPGGFGTGVLTREQANRPRRFRELMQALLATYPADHRCCLLTSQFQFSLPGQVHWFQIRRLCEMARHIDYHATLFVPPRQEFRIQQSQFVSRLYDRRHASRLVNRLPVGTTKR
jgi:tetrapyrrole (corrin/porphyrin) methylase-like protein